MGKITKQQQSGLKEFSRKHPSDFSVKSREAVDYYVNKVLKHYTTCPQVPIKSLFGHQNQASPGVRFISGKRIEDFRDFLCRHPEAFIVEQDTVMVKHESAQNLAVQKSKVLQSTQIITRAEESLQVIQGIFSQVMPGGAAVAVGLDCEGVNLGKAGQVTLLQLGLNDGRAYIFDIASCPKLITDGGLKLLLESVDVVKIIHDCRSDSANLFSQFGVVLANVFDTQICYAVWQEKATGTPGRQVQVSFNDLCAEHKLPLNPLKDKMKKVYMRKPPYWAQRPLTEDMIVYAAADVLPLPRLYNIMIRQITPGCSRHLVKMCDARARQFRVQRRQGGKISKRRQQRIRNRKL